MARKEIGTGWNREQRNAINDNFKELYGDSSVLDWREPVDYYNDLPNETTDGETRMVRDTGKVYRYSEGSWGEIQELNANPINEVDSRLNAKIDDNMNSVSASLAQTTTEIENVKSVKMDKNAPVAITQIDKNSGKLDQTYFTDETIEQWTGNTPVSTTPALKSTTRERIANKAVNFEHMDFIEESTNLFNMYGVAEGYTIDASTGEPSANSSFNLSGFIPTVSNQEFIASGLGRWAFYDENMGFISSSTSESFTAPENAFYARFVVSNGNIRTAQINKGSTLLPFESHYKNMRADAKNGLQIKPTSLAVDNDAVDEQVISPNKTTYWKTPKNVFNKHDLLYDKIITQDGDLIDNAGTVVSKSFIPAKSEQDYMNSETIRVNTYNKDKLFINQIQISTDVGFATPLGTRFIKISIVSGRENDLMVNEGTTQLPYEDYIYKLESTNEFPIVVPESGGGGGDSSSEIQAFDVPFLYESTETLDTTTEATVCDITDNCYVQEIEMATDGANCELEINIRESDGTLLPYQLMANDGSGYIPITTENLINHGTVDFLFSAYEHVADEYKFTMKGKQYANGLQVKIRNNDTVTKNITCRVVGGTYA
ncbi:hypothetical protein [Virgibacillus sp. CBA3643]|uniref:hypothetical protein n=1 Tax=Virgibacillus sp. CBA3643 TaxID=2942278 RepID=UPI0035A370F6